MARGRPKYMRHERERYTQRRRNKDFEPYYCPRCSEPFDHFDELQDHALDVHKVNLRSVF